MGVLPTTTAGWIGIAGALAVALAIRRIRHRGLTVAAVLAILMLVGVLGYVTA
ncbi:MAG: hypothetical protein WAQ33_12490 [Gaiellaceae bacterium]